ncbi:MAG: 1-deoxy-D-xylulose-5-phosphate reductoisomerase [Marinilabiliaceae bacterium]|nr:1-deoxy-D-xylulose-5-phosphate reductoisomerase [Marinilabiliaceae bacterium]
MKRIAILGSTGSIGKQALEVVDQNQEFFSVEVLTANDNAELLIKQAITYQPNVVVIANKEKYKNVKDALSNFPIKVFAGASAIEEVASMSNIDMVLSALVGFSGLKPAMQALQNGIPIALANKEALVVAGDLMTELSLKNKTPIIPVDSEHSAIFQCLQGELHNQIEKIILTASGGPFKGKSVKFLETITLQQALEHPIWKNMGNKVTIDSASLMNKGLEAIEAKWLFNLHPSQIEVVVHPQSIIHSMVQFSDGSIKAQLGLPDMRLPIQYALGYPKRLKNNFPRFNYKDYSFLSFESIDVSVFRNLKLAFEAMKSGGNTPCILNAANEVAVNAFLMNKIKFTDIPSIIEKTIEQVDFIAKPNFDDLMETDKKARIVVSGQLFMITD